jgi:ATP-dependent Zn protease
MSWHDSTPEADQRTADHTRRWSRLLLGCIQRVLVLAVVLWVVLSALPRLAGFVTGPNFAPIVLQVLLLASYLLLFIGFQVALIYFFLARTRIHWVLPERARVRFRDYRGNPAALTAASRIVLLLKGVRQTQGPSGDLLGGLLLTGPPGVGKRYLAQAIANEAEVPIGYLNAASLAISRFGMGAIKVGMIYRKARKLAREYGACILLIDEIEAIGNIDDAALAARRTLETAQPAGDQDTPSGTLPAQADWISAGGRRGVLSELLLQIDPPYHKQPWWRRLLRMQPGAVPAVLTIATTTHSEQLDRALLHPGRFHRRIAINLPDEAGRRDILHYYLERIAHEPLPLDRLAIETAGMPPAAIRQMVGEAVIFARLEGRRSISYADLRQARATREPAPPRVSATLPTPAPPPPAPPYAEQRQVACYLAGQAYVRWHAADATAANGQAPAEQASISRDDMLHDIQQGLAGRAAEEELLEVQTVQAAPDLDRATRMAAMLVGTYGMDRQLFSYGADGQESLQQAMLYDDLHERTEKLLQEQYRQVRALIASNKQTVQALTAALLLTPELSEPEIASLLDHLEARYADSAARTTTATAVPPSFLVARRAPPREQAPPPHSLAFIEPQPALPDDITPEAQPHADDEPPDNLPAAPDSEPPDEPPGEQSNRQD